MTPDYTIKRGDTGKVLTGQLLDSSGTAPDFTDYDTATLSMVSIAGGDPKIDAEEITFTDAETATWTYAMQSTDVDTTGWYKAEIEVVMDGVTYTFPTDKDTPYLLILIQDDLG